MKASITIDGKTYKIDASHYDTVDVENGYVVFWKSGYGTTSVKIAEEGAGDIERVRSYLLFVFQPHKLFTSSFHKETDLNTRTFLHNEVSRIYKCNRSVVEKAVEATNEKYKAKYGVYASNDPYSDFEEIYDMFTQEMKGADNGK